MLAPAGQGAVRASEPPDDARQRAQDLQVGGHGAGLHGHEVCLPPGASMCCMRDDLGQQLTVDRVRRVVSLVPSLTESLAESGLLVGVTDWCKHPADLDVVRVRGTKNPDLARIVNLAPDLVIANDEENRAVDLDALRAAGLAVWVTNPETVPQALVSLGRMLAVCGVPEPSWLQRAREVWDAPVPEPVARAVVPIWRRPWMHLGRDTFAGDVLARLGVANVLAGHAGRYPQVDLADVPAYDLVVLPDEPYAFSPTDGPEAFPGVRVSCVSGRHLTWYGPSLAEARDVLREQLGLYS
jgi:ABC-type Fe3+-hydroxamate transport system substrate-binding protein